MAPLDQATFRSGRGGSRSGSDQTIESNSPELDRRYIPARYEVGYELARDALRVAAPGGKPARLIEIMPAYRGRSPRSYKHWRCFVSSGDGVPPGSSSLDSAASKCRTGWLDAEYLTRHTLRLVLDQLRPPLACQTSSSGRILLAAYGVRHPTKDTDSNAMRATSPPSISPGGLRTSP